MTSDMIFYVLFFIFFIDVLLLVHSLAKVMNYKSYIHHYVSLKSEFVTTEMR